MQLASVPRKLRGHHDRFVMAAQAARLTPGLTLGVTVFAYPDNFVTKRKILHTITSAKTVTPRCCANSTYRQTLPTSLKNEDR